MRIDPKLTTKCWVGFIVRLASSRWLPNMFNVLGQGYPGMFVLFPDGDRGGRKSWLGEGTHGDGNRSFVAFYLVVNNRAAMRAEIEDGLSTFIAYPNILRG